MPRACLIWGCRGLCVRSVGGMEVGGGGRKYGPGEGAGVREDFCQFSHQSAVCAYDQWNLGDGAPNWAMEGKFITSTCYHGNHEHSNHK